MDITKAVASITPETKAFVTLLEQANLQHRTPNESVEGALGDPAKTIETLGIEVEPAFRVAVSQGLASLLASLAKTGKPSSPSPEGTDLEEVSARLNDRPLETLDTVGAAVDVSLRGPLAEGLRSALGSLGSKFSSGKPTENKSVRLLIKPWGVALALDPSAAQRAGDGLDMTRSVADGVAAGVSALAATPAGPYALLAAVLIKVFSIFISTNRALIKTFDEGKGVYLTYTWLHIICMMPPWYNPIAAIPIPTPIR